MDDVGVLFKAVFFSLSKAQIQEVDFLTPQQVHLIKNQEIIRYQDGFLCDFPTRFFPILINKPEFWIKAWPYCNKLFKDNFFSLIHTQENTTWIQSSSHGVLYLNGKPIKKASLHNGDWIFAGGHSFFWYDSLLLCPGISQENVCQSLPLKIALSRPREKIYSAIYFEDLKDFTTLKIEPPLELEAESSLSLTSSSSTGSMMLISTLVSTLSSLIISPFSSSTLPTLLSGGIGALAFIVFYGWQAKKHQLKKRQLKAKSRNDYLNYLQEQIEKIESLRQERSTRFSFQKQSLFSFDKTLKHSQNQENWKVPIALSKKSYIHLELPKLSWQLAQSPSQKALLQLENLDLSTLGWSFICQGQGSLIFYQSEKQLEYFYLLWCWIVFNKNRRFVWIGFPRPSRIHPSSLIEGEILYFETVQAFWSFKTRFSSLEWTICVHPDALEKLNLPSILSIEKSTNTPFLKSNSLKETWILCRSFNQSLSFWPEIPCLDLIFPSTLFDPHLWRQSAYLPIEESENGQLPWSYKYFLIEDHEKSLFQIPQANMKVEIAPGIFWDLIQEGPHALVAGVTGSGKSEGLCSILFQLALQNPADLVRFVLIDFKGGSFSAPLQDLPHVAALLTNLASQEIHRLEVALQSEVDRRQSVLLKWLEKNPGSIPDLEHCQDPKTGKIFSHLLICVDEFGQLKARFPDFLKFLQETARIGRSLGIHLILSTQKPAGLVDEQIWANSKAKLCFPVLDLADSREVLGHEKAAQLKKSGEFILQIGNESEKKGRAFYLKKPASGRSSLFILDGKTWKEIATISLQDAMRQKILDRKEKVAPLMICDPKSQVDQLQGIVEDCIDHAPLFSLDDQGLVLVLGQEENLKLLASQLAWQCDQRKHPVLNTTHFSIYLSQSISLSSLWLLKSTSSPLVIFANLNEIPIELIDFISQKSKITLVLFTDHISFRQEKILAKVKLKLIAGVSSKDQLALASDGKLRQEEGFPVIHALQDNQEKRLIVGKKQSTQDQRKALLFSLPTVQLQSTTDSLLEGKPGLIGIEAKTLKPIYFPQDGLTIAWSIPSLKEKAKNLALRLQLENPLLSFASKPNSACLCLLDLSESLDGASELKQAIDIGPVLFIGKGLSAWQYLLQLTLPMETVGDSLLIENSLGCDIQMASFIDSFLEST